MRLGGHSLPIIKDSFLLADFQGTQRGSQELRDTCMIDGILLQANAVTAKILDVLTKAVEVVKGIIFRLEEGHAQSSPLVTTALHEAATTLSQKLQISKNTRQRSRWQWTRGQLRLAFLEEKQRNVNSIPTSNSPSGAGGRTLRISCLTRRKRPDGSTEMHCSRSSKTVGIFQIGYRTSRSAHPSMDTL